MVTRMRGPCPGRKPRKPHILKRVQDPCCPWDGCPCSTHLGRASDHVLDEIPVAGGVDDGDVVFGGLKLPEGDVNGDTTLPLCLQFVQHPGVFEGTLPHLEGLRAWSGQEPSLT